MSAQSAQSAPVAKASDIGTTSLNQASSSGVKREAIPATPVMPRASVPPSSHRYMKIQPAIAIKPKPVPIAMLPKPNTITTKFDPSPNVKSSLNMNVNTLKKWVLPPRPRPGRKPTPSSAASSCDEGNDLSPTPVDFPLHKNSPKKKQKTYKDDDMKTQIINQLNQQFPRKLIVQLDVNSSSTNGASSESRFVLPKVPVPSVKTSGTTTSSMNLNNNGNKGINGTNGTNITNVTNTTSINSDPYLVLKAKHEEDTQNSVRNLKKYYCSKIKEQQLVQNYIEVISNQIKELRFVQNGVITVNALTDEKRKVPLLKPTSSATTTTAPPPLVQSEQLEKINNINDLNKFLGYLSKSSNIIHSVTKNYAGGSEENFDGQIQSYLEEKKHCKELDNEVGKSSTNSNGNGNGYIKMTPPTILSLGSNKGGVSCRSNKKNVHSTGKNSGVLQSIREDKGPELDLMEDISFNEDMGLFSVEELDDYVLIDRNKFFEDKRVRTSGCGFCGNGTPCLCLDSDIEIRKLRK